MEKGRSKLNIQLWNGNQLKYGSVNNSTAIKKKSFDNYGNKVKFLSQG